MLSDKVIIRLSFVISLISWLAATALGLIITFGVTNNTDPGVYSHLPHLLLVIFYIGVYLFFQYTIQKSEQINFLELLWRVFVTGLVAIVISLIIRAFLLMLGDSKITDNPLLVNFFYFINIGLVSAFLISTYVVWKKLVLYQKTKRLLKLWQIYEYALLASLAYIFIDQNTFGIAFDIVLGLLLLMGLLLAGNLKWVAYLTFKQKWKSILLLLLIGLYLWYFVIYLSNFSSNYFLVVDLLNNVFVLSLFAFIFIYAVFSLLVILFNLPTTSVFEQKLEEVINFQKLSQSRNTGHNEEQVYEILLDSSISAVIASAAWIEIYDKRGKRKKILHHKTQDTLIDEVKNALASSKIKKILSSDPVKNLKTNRFTANIKGLDYKSVFVFPLFIQDHQVATLFLLKDVEDGFNKEMIDIIRTFVNQACISIENFRLLEEALDNERYKEELKIAKNVQRSLLPSKLINNRYIEMSAYTKAADEVGGDYYDMFQFDNELTALIIGDVSGKGTSAAFHMSQMKGVFHSLVELSPYPHDFLINANLALSRCLDRASFITISYFLINAEEKTIDFARAGHCPTLFYENATDKADFYESQGLGLGILRNKQYRKYVQVNQIKYKPGDILYLYTDGITEAKNNVNEEYGYDRLKNSLSKNAKKPLSEIQTSIIKEVFAFCGKHAPDDDYTSLIIRFK